MNGFTIYEKLPSLNEYINACRANKHKGALFKSDIENKIGWSIITAVKSGKLKPVTKPCEIHIYWHEATKRRDVDNIQSAQKFILDAMQTMGIIKNDSRRYVRQIYHEIIDDNEDYVVVTLCEVEKERK